MKRRVLVVEDNLPSRELLHDWLETKGFQPASAANLQEAYATATTAPPDIVLLDVQLGDEDGLSFASWLRQQPDLKELPVIAVTAHAMVTDQERVIRAGCNTCIAKPVDFVFLEQQMSQWLLVKEVVLGKTADAC